MAARNGSTRAWRRARARVLREESVCTICGQLVDKMLSWPDPMSASVDHSDPVSLGGSLLDRSNHGLAHLGCNSRKGNGARPIGPDGPIITSRDW
jgi:5-methylcytosine-specific restriction endonuclease McrA